MKVTHIFHSCFVVETEKAVFIFDYYLGKINNLPKNKPIYFFVSHGHLDHCGIHMLDIGKKVKERKYIFTEDVRIRPDDTECFMYIEENQSYALDGFVFHTFHSTDVGVAYLIETDEGVIYHAGDLNWWHWNGESKEFNEQMALDYHAEVAKIAELNKVIDVAFLPLDQRQENAYDWGMKYFMEHVKVKTVLPMHFFSENFDICKKAIVENGGFTAYGCEFIAVEHVNQEFEI